MIQLIEQTAEGFTQRYTSGPYEAIKSNGLDKIKNDSLRALLIENYDERLPAQMVFIKYINESCDQRIDEARKALVGSKIISIKGKPVI